MKYKVKINHSIVPLASAEAEWAYLVNETLEGEKCIVPQLRKLKKHPVVLENKGLLETLSRQLDEEVEHVRLFNGLIGVERIKGSGYRDQLMAYVDSLPSVTLKLFALQGMLEGYALGALRHRLRVISDSPSERVDAQALYEEIGHVAFSFDHFSYLKNAEGEHSRQEFKEVSKEVNKIFSQSFKGENIARIFKNSFGIEIEGPHLLDKTDSMAAFQSLSKMSVIQNKNQFLIQYYQGEKCG